MLCTFRKYDGARVSPGIVGHGQSVDEDRSKRAKNSSKSERIERQIAGEGRRLVVTMAPDDIAVGVSQGDVEHERIGIRGRVRLSHADRCRAVGRCWPAGATARLFRRRLTVQDHGRSDQLRALRTYHAIVFEPPVNR